MKISGAFRRGTPPHWPEALPYARLLVKRGPDRTVWGSDWPYLVFDGPVPTADQLLGWLSDNAHRVPGFHLLTVIIGQNPFTGEVVPRTAQNLIKGFITLMPNGEAHRVQVKLGRSSVNQIEVVDGLREGDQVVLSDMSTWDAYDRVKLN